MTEPTSTSYEFNPDDLTLGESEELEEASGKSLGEITVEYQSCAVCGKPHSAVCGTCGKDHQAPKIGAKGKPLQAMKYDHEWTSSYDHDRLPPLRGKTLSAIAWILERRNNPDFTLDDARQITVRQLFGVEAPAPKGQAASTGT